MAVEARFPSDKTRKFAGMSKTCFWEIHAVINIFSWVVNWNQVIWNCGVGY